MARPFYVPEDDQEQQGSSQPPSGSSSVTQSPLQSPLMVNNEHLVQAFCEALYRIGGGTPAFPLPPPSPSCSPHATPQSTAGHYGEIFFPRSISTPRTPRTYTHQPLEEVHRVPSHPIEQQRLPIRRIRLTSTGEDEDDYPSDHDGSLNDFQEHFHHLEARERLTEFPGRVPDRKKGKSLPPPPAADPETPKDKPKEQCFNWSLVTALFIVVGCGIFASR
ncbi:cell death protein hid [Lutzomyia longipalpis]|uniref:cell death protein hid n=1 Tax=Lutzomyia longipalpis TaxID=7200 RepID=UPI00248342DD|nr:cell death protein hid [Lutzomyia longipalpis]